MADITFGDINLGDIYLDLDLELNTLIDLSSARQETTYATTTSNVEHHAGDEYISTVSTVHNEVITFNDTFIEENSIVTEAAEVSEMGDGLGFLPELIAAGLVYEGIKHIDQPGATTFTFLGLLVVVITIWIIL